MSRVFDGKELLDRLDNDWDFLAETVQMLGTDGRALMEQVKTAAANGDAEALGRAGHTLKGMVSNFCAPAAYAAAFEVEQIGKSGDLSAARPAVDALGAQLETLITGLNDFLATKP